MVELKNFINQIYKLPEEVLQGFISQLDRREIEKNEYLVRSESFCNKSFIILKGLVRHYYLDDKGRERNTWFSGDKSITTDISSMINLKKSKENIQVLENSIVYEVSFSEILKLQKKHHEFCLWYSKMIEIYYFNQIEQRVQELQFLDATQRYQSLLDRNPTFGNRISLGNIASYLNISQATLSRIRASK